MLSTTIDAEVDPFLSSSAFSFQNNSIFFLYYSKLAYECGVSKSLSIVTEELSLKNYVEKHGLRLKLKFHCNFLFNFKKVILKFSKY